MNKVADGLKRKADYEGRNSLSRWAALLEYEEGQEFLPLS